MPQGPHYINFTHWWLTWSRLGQECDLRDQDWTHQFLFCLNHKGYFSKYLEEIIEHDLCVGGTERPLQKRKNYVEKKLMIAFKAKETLLETVPTGFKGPSLPFGKSGQSPPAFYKCGKPVHFASACYTSSKGCYNIHKYPLESFSTKATEGILCTEC